MDIALIISVLASVLSVSNFVLARKDKAVKDTKENHQELIEYQLKELKEDVKKILDILDNYDKDIDERVQKGIALHEQIYHNVKKEK